MEAELKHPHVFKENIADAINEPIMVIGVDYRVLFMNKAAHEFVPDGQEISGPLFCHQISHHSSTPCTGNDHPCPLEEVKISGNPVSVVHKHFLPSGEERFMEIFASPVWGEEGTFKGIVELIRDITELKRREFEHDAIANLTASLRIALTRSDIVKIMLDHLFRLMKLKNAALITINPASGNLFIEQAQGSWESLNEQSVQSAEDMCRQILKSSSSYINNDIQSDPVLAKSDLFVGLRSVICFPLLAQDKTIGAFLLGRKNVFINDELRLIGAICDIAANAIYRTTLCKQTEQRLQRLSALREIDMAISGSLDLRVTLSVFLDQVTSKLHVDAANVLLMNPHNHLLEYAAGRGFRKAEIQETRQRLGEGTAGRVAQERSIVRISNLQEITDGFDRSWMIKGENFITYYALPLISKGDVKGVLEIFHRMPMNPDEEWHDFLQALAVQAAIAIDNASLFDKLHHSNIELIMAYESTLESWSKILDLRDEITEGHSKRVAEMTLLLADKLGISEEEMVHVGRGALLHDIGKLGIPDSVLLKPGPLSEEEWEVMRLHPVYAYKMLSSIDYLSKALYIPLCHHEKWDGTGYPHGLKAEQIPLAARIFSVVDVWDALLSDRPYRLAWPKEQVCEYIRTHAETNFDPKVVELFLHEMGA